MYLAENIHKYCYSIHVVTSKLILHPTRVHVFLCFHTTFYLFLTV